MHFTTENMRFLTLLLSNYFYLLSVLTGLKRLLVHGTFKNAGSKPVRGRFHGCGTLTWKEALGT